jgi:DNA polymerase V
MRDAGIHSADTLIVDKSYPADRQIVVAMIDGEFTVKRFRKANGFPRFYSHRVLSVRFCD